MELSCPCRKIFYFNLCKLSSIQTLRKQACKRAVTVVKGLNVLCKDLQHLWRSLAQPVWKINTRQSHLAKLAMSISNEDNNKAKHLQSKHSPDAVTHTKHEEVSHSEGDKTLAQVGQRGCGCPVPRNVQGHLGWGLEQPGRVKVSLYKAGEGCNEIIYKGLFQPRLFYGWQCSLIVTMEWTHLFC